MPTRAKKKVNGKWQPAGSYLVDIVTKTVGRIVKASGVFPYTKNSADTYDQIKVMLKDLDTQRDEVRLTQIKFGKVRLLDALGAYRAGRIYAAEAYAGDKLLPAMVKWLKTYSASTYTTTTFTHYVNRLLRLGLLTPATEVRQLPDIARNLRTKFNREAKAVYFRAIRQMLISFLKDGLGYDNDSFLLKEVKKVPLVPVRSRREHNPLGNLAELIELAGRVNSSGRWGNRGVDYASWIVFMALTGLRPTEFERGAWERDAKTGHVRIKGTKTINANRVVPNVVWLKAEPRRLANLQMRLINLDPPTAVRCRDFRRTAALFYEAAGVPRYRYSYYLGHGARDITGLYEKRTPTQADLDMDCEKFRAWMLDQRTNKPQTRPRTWSPTAQRFMKDLEHVFVLE